ncbi:DUF2840 domain-containing protein [Nguyenibacter vanlangensis]|uniref:DUF2840 domain-containing protein n=1 Tax=Nguyenibacter vanlangensis TaxID=1216886 RepID=UPI0038D059D5
MIDNANGAFRNMIRHGDSVSLMRAMPRGSVDFILTDPPYLVGYQGRDGRTVRPGGEVLLHQSSWPRVQRVLEAIDAVEAQGIDPREASPDCWRHLHHRLEARQQPDAHNRARHRAWLRRRALQ